jgi:predicted AlkP superfamily pyrophosphatase or phosphodiesterase
MRPKLLSVVSIVAAVILGTSLRADIPSPRHVVMISVDGMKPSVYMQPGPSKVPTLRRLMARGAHAELVGVLPTVTYPSHTTIITGVLPAAHGIYNNYVLDPEGLSNGSWYYYSRDIKAPMLHGLMKARGLTTAGVFWPVSVGADIDYLLPEFAVTPHPKSKDLMRALSNPRSLIDAYEASTGAAMPWPMTDRERTALTAWILRTYRPHLTLLHIFDTDTAEHKFGPDTPEALATFEAADANIKILVDTIEAAGMADRTDIVVVSDHGFLPASRQVQVNAVFKREGLLETDGSGKISRWDAYYQATGGLGFVFLKRPDDGALAARVAKLLENITADPANGVERLFDRAALDQAGADPRASFALDFKAGFQSGSGTDVLVKTGGAKGTHGFAPTRPELHASLIMAGPDVPNAGSLGTVRMTQIGPTIASWFGLVLSPEADAPLKLGRATK